MGLQLIQRVGRTPWSARVPLDPLPSTIDKYQQQADVGVGRGPRGSAPLCIRPSETSVFDGVNASDCNVNYILILSDNIFCTLAQYDLP